MSTYNLGDPCTHTFVHPMHVFHIVTVDRDVRTIVCPGHQIASSRWVPEQR